MFGSRPEHPLTLLAPALTTTTTTTTSTRHHCRPTVPVPRSSRGPSCSRQPRSGRLFCRSRRQRRHDLTTSRRPRFRFVPATERLPLRLLLTTATSLSADVPWLPSSPASRRSTLRSPATAHWNRSSQQPAVAALTLLRLTRSNRPGAISLRTHCRARTQLKLHFRSTFHNAATHCQTHVRSLARSTVNCSHSRNFFASH